MIQIIFEILSLFDNLFVFIYFNILIMFILPTLSKLAYLNKFFHRLVVTIINIIG